MCIHAVSYHHKQEFDKFSWVHNVKKEEFLKFAHEPKLIKSQFGINNPTHFFAVSNFKLGFLYSNFPKIDCEILKWMLLIFAGI